MAGAGGHQTESDRAVAFTRVIGNVANQQPDAPRKQRGVCVRLAQLGSRIIQAPPGARHRTASGAGGP
jgi:hypothetical protein